MVRLIRVSRFKRESWALMPRLADLMLNFGLRVGQTNAPQCVGRLEADFIMDGQILPDGRTYEACWAAWVALDDGPPPDGGRILGHVVAVVELFADEPIVYVNQLEVLSGAPKGVKHQALEEVRQWARDKKCKRMLMMTHLDLPRLWKRWGFKKYRTVYESTL